MKSFKTGKAVPMTVVENGETKEIAGIMSLWLYPRGLTETHQLETALIRRDFLLVTLVFIFSLPFVLCLWSLEG